MISKSYFSQVLGSQVLTLSLAMLMITMTLTGITTSSPPLVQSADADHGQEIVLTPGDTSFASVSSGEGGNQVKVVVNYAVHEPMVTNDLVKGVMKVYSPSGSLLKTSSSPTPFPIAGSHGTATFATTLTDPTIKDVIAKIVFTNPIKTETLSNELPVSISLINDATLTGKSEERAISQAPQESDSQSKEENESLPDETLPSAESAIASPKDEERQSVKFEDVPPIQESQQVAPTESMPQTIVNPYVSSYPPLQPTTVEPEICNDSIDNDVDTLIDMSDGDCNLSEIQQQQLPPIMQQEPSKESSLEICDDDLDNDLDSKVDNKDEECTYISGSRSSFPLLEQEQSVAEEQTVEEEDEDKAEVKEQQSDEELAEGSNEIEEGDGSDSSELNNEEGEDEGEDEDEE